MSPRRDPHPTVQRHRSSRREPVARGAGRPRLRILLADEHPVLRAGLRALVLGAHDLELAGEVSTLAEAAPAAAACRADAVVCDLGAPDALAAVAALRALAPAPGVLALAPADGDERLLAAVRTGLRGSVPRTAEGAAILRALRAVAHGEAHFGEEVADRLLALVGSAAPGAAAFPELSAREREVLALLARGASTGQIARALALSPKTIRNHVSLICTKLGVLDRVGAALRAREAGLGLPSAA